MCLFVCFLAQSRRWCSVKMKNDQIWTWQWNHKNSQPCSVFLLAILRPQILHMHVDTHRTCTLLIWVFFVSHFRTGKMSQHFCCWASWLLALNLLDHTSRCEIASLYCSPTGNYPGVCFFIVQIVSGNGSKESGFSQISLWTQKPEYSLQEFKLDQGREMQVNFYFCQWKASFLVLSKRILPFLLSWDKVVVWVCFLFIWFNASLMHLFSSKGLNSRICSTNLSFTANEDNSNQYSSQFKLRQGFFNYIKFLFLLPL